MKTDGLKPLEQRSEEAYTVVEVVVAVFILGIMVISLFAGFSSGFAVVQLGRENLRATQIMVQKMEAVRLYNWKEITNSAFLKPSFTDYYNPATSNGAVYNGFISVSPNPAGIPAAYANNMRAITVTLFWTNYPRKPQTNIIVRSRAMQTYFSRYGMQTYIYQ
jgi:hypothetical protein